MRRLAATLACCLLMATPSFCKLIQRMFDIKNIPTSTWIVQRTINEREFQSCSFHCLYDLAHCAAFSVSSGVCQIGTFNGFFPLEGNDVGTQVFIVDNSHEPPGEAGFAVIDLVLVPHVAYLALRYGYTDISLNSTLSPPLTFPAPHADIAGYFSSFNFYANNKFYMCGAENDSPLVTSMFCYSWSLGSGLGFAKEPGTMLYAHAEGAGISMNGTFWLTGGAPVKGGAEHQHTELWQDGTWTAGPDLPKVMRLHSLVQLSDTQFLLIGGYSGGAIKDTWTYDFSTALWTYRNTYPGIAVWDMAAAMYTMSDGTQYVISVGGYYVYSYTYMASYTYCDIWRLFSGCPWCVCTVWYVATGYAYTGVGQVNVYDVASGNWSAGTALPGQLYGGNFLYYDNQLLLFGGYDENGLTDVINVFDPVAGWEEYNETGLATPGPRILPIIYN